MKTLDLSRPFIKLIADAQTNDPASNVASALTKVTAPLKSYAVSLGLTIEELSLLHVCADKETHPDLEQHIGNLQLTDAYKGQHRSRLKSLIMALLCPEATAGGPASNILPLEEQLPEPLATVWTMLPRPSRIASAYARQVEPEVYSCERVAMGLSARGVGVALAILQVWKDHAVSSSEELFEQYAVQVVDTIRRSNPPSKWDVHISAFYYVRQRYRETAKYEVKDEPPVMLTIDQLPQPLRSQVLAYKERALFGFKEHGHIKVRARTRYDLDLSGQEETSVLSNVDILCLGIGYLPREMYGESLDVRDFLRLVDREVEVDEIIIKELYNPQVDYYRQLEQAKHSDRKESGFDSGSFHKFIWALAAVAAYNGYLELRRLFLKEYTVVLDKDSKERHKQTKKETFDRPWLDGQIQQLRARFKRIAAEGTFKNEKGGTLSRKGRFDLNLCLFYVIIVALRYMGVRQQCVRDCLIGKNMFFVAPMRVTFLWTDKETKNAQGLLHRFNMEQHAEVQETLIEAVNVYYRNIYPYLSGEARTDQPQNIREARRQAVANQFFLKCNPQGICVPFTGVTDFGVWFKRRTLNYIDFGSRLARKGLWLNPHFLRAVFGDWCRFELGFSGEQTAQLAGDTEKTFEAEYITHPSTYDATDAWTQKSQEIRAKRMIEEPAAKKKTGANRSKGGRDK